MFDHSYRSVLVLVPLVLAACTDPRDLTYIVDGPRGPAFERDVAQCRALVDQGRPINTSNATLQSTAIGGLGGAITGDVEGAVAGAAVGMISGASAETRYQQERQRAAIITCLRGRGHRVIS